MHTVVETQAYLKAAQRAGLTDADRRLIVSQLAAEPAIGDVIVGSGGCRKWRFGYASRGKRGGVRIITVYGGQQMPVFLLTVFAKNERSDLTRSEIAQLAALTKDLLAQYGT
jgi:hypothetical protein